MTTIGNFDAEIQVLQNKLEAARKAKQEFLDMPPDKQLVIRLHATECKWNHDYGCNWEYGIKNGVHDWVNNHAHTKYLGIVEKIRARDIDVETYVSMREKVNDIMF